jgi:DNA-binding NarL/FixJ family response regulator
MSDAERGEREPIKVLLADDVDEVRMLLRMNLTLDGRFSVVGEAADGSSAVALTASLRPDVVVLDLYMPGMPGLQAIPQILEYSPQTKVVVLSGRMDARELEPQAKALGAQACLDKNSDFHHLTSKLIEAVQG